MPALRNLSRKGKIVVEEKPKRQKDGPHMEEVEDGGELPHGPEFPEGKSRRRRPLDERRDHSPGSLLLFLLPAREAALRLRWASGGSGWA